MCHVQRWSYLMQFDRESRHSFVQQLKKFKYTCEFLYIGHHPKVQPEKVDLTRSGLENIPSLTSKA